MVTDGIMSRTKKFSQALESSTQSYFPETKNPLDPSGVFSAEHDSRASPWVAEVFEGQLKADNANK